MKEPHLAEDEVAQNEDFSQEDTGTLLELDALLEDLLFMEEGLHLSPEAKVSLLRRIFSKRAREVHASRKLLDLAAERKDIIASEVAILQKEISKKVEQKKTIKTSNGKVIRMIEWLGTHSNASKRVLQSIFNREELIPKSTGMEILRAGFKLSLMPWEQAGLFSEERVKKGYCPPNWEEDYLPLITQQDIERMEGIGNHQGHGRAVWAPADVPIASEDEEEDLTYLKVAEKALVEAYYGTAGGKKANTLLVGPEKRVLTANQIDLKNILYKWWPLANPGLVYNPKRLDPKNHGGKSEAEMLASLRGIERKTGGVLRLERDQLIMPKDIGKNRMYGHEWYELIQSGFFPSEVKFQDVKQALAYNIHCLNTQGWIPDYYDYNNPSSRVALAPETYIPVTYIDMSPKAFAIPAFYWEIIDKSFCAGDGNISAIYLSGGVRSGMRKNNKED